MRPALHRALAPRSILAATEVPNRRIRRLPYARVSTMNGDFFQQPRVSGSVSSLLRAGLSGSPAAVRKKPLPKFQFPTTKAVVFWPVGTGDSTTLILVPGRLVMQIDL